MWYSNGFECFFSNSDVKNHWFEAETRKYVRHACDFIRVFTSPSTTRAHASNSIAGESLASSVSLYFVSSLVLSGFGFQEWVELMLVGDAEANLGEWGTSDILQTSLLKTWNELKIAKWDWKSRISHHPILCIDIGTKISSKIYPKFPDTSYVSRIEKESSTMFIFFQFAFLKWTNSIRVCNVLPFHPFIRDHNHP